MPGLIAIDAGTTNTRAWRVRDGRIEQFDSRPVGVRDTAHDGHNQKLVGALRELISSVRGDGSVWCVAAAGMITSALGLREIVHCDAPAGASELAARGVKLHRPEICELPVWLFPGVRCGDWSSAATAESCDMMRGEETLCLGLAGEHAGQTRTVLNLGSHWKAIQIDERGRIAGSWTTLSGELIHAVMTQTILASAVPAGRPQAIDQEWCQRGSAATQRDGFSRALFEVRLWEVRAAQQVSPQQRLSFLIGSAIEESLTAFRAAGFLQAGPVTLIGQGGIAAGWSERLQRDGLVIEIIDSEQTADCFVRGISQLIALLHIPGSAHL